MLRIIIYCNYYSKLSFPLSFFSLGKTYMIVFPLLLGVFNISSYVVTKKPKRNQNRFLFVIIFLNIVTWIGKCRHIIVLYLPTVVFYQHCCIIPKSVVWLGRIFETLCSQCVGQTDLKTHITIINYVRRFIRKVKYESP